MNRTRLWISAGIIACIILIAFALSVPHTRDVGVKSDASTTTNVSDVTVRDIFKKGVHTISGSLEVSNVCTPISASATLVGDASSTERIVVALALQVDSGICLQIPTNVDFQTTVTAPARLPIDVTVNGAPASTTPS